MSAIYKALEQTQSLTKELSQANEKIEAIQDLAKKYKDEVESLTDLREDERANSYSLGRADAETEFEDQISQLQDEKEKLILYLNSRISSLSEQHGNPEVLNQSMIEGKMESFNEILKNIS